jgi:hypothetical protein
MAGTLDEYKRLFREAHVEDQRKLLRLHLIIYLVINVIWVILNFEYNQPFLYWVLLYPIVGWGLLLVVHWWFYVRNAEGLCRLREVNIEARLH